MNDILDAAYEIAVKGDVAMAQVLVDELCRNSGIITDAPVFVAEGDSFFKSKCGRFNINPKFSHSIRPTGYNVVDNTVNWTSSAFTLKEAKEIAKKMANGVFYRYQKASTHPILKNAKRPPQVTAYALYDENGVLIPLSKRFSLKICQKDLV